MTTTTTTADAIDNSLFNIQYPNCGRGMFSLRQPFKDMKTEILPMEERPASIRNLTPAAVQSNVPMIEEPILPRARSKRSAQVQCSLLRSHDRHDMAVQTKFDQEEISNDDHRHHKKFPPIERYEKIYEIWEFESPRLEVPFIDHTMKRKEIPIMRHMKQKKPIIEYPDDDDDDDNEIESDYDEERIIYARRPRKTIKKTYLPPNVRMICVRDDANRISH